MCRDTVRSKLPARTDSSAQALAMVDPDWSELDHSEPLREKKQRAQFRECNSALRCVDCGAPMRGTVLLLGGLRHRKPRHHVLAHGGVVYEPGFDSGGLHQIARLRAIVEIHV